MLKAWFLGSLILANTGEDIPNTEQLDNFFKTELAVHGSEYQRPIKRSEIIIIQNDTFLNPEGTLYLYKIQNNALRRIDKSTFHGVFFGRYLFQHENIIYQFGGQGLFLKHSNLLMFDSVNVDWRLIEIDETLLGFLPKLAFTKGDSLVFIAENDLADQIFGIFDFKTGKTVLKPSSLPPDDIYMLNRGNFLENENIVMWLATANEAMVMMLDKHTLELKKLSNVPISGASLVLNSHLGKDFAEFQHADGHNLNVSLNDFNTTTKIHVNSHFKLRRLLMSIALVFVSYISCLVYFSIVLYRNPVLLTILECWRSSMDVDQFNQLFNLSGDYYSMKTKRAQLVKTLNQFWFLQIRRKKDALDQRRIVYKISYSFLVRMLRLPLVLFLIRRLAR